MNPELFKIVGFLLSSAQGLLEEPKEYGPLRLLEAASRIIEYETKQKDDDELSALKGLIDSKKLDIMEDNCDFTSVLDEILLKYLDLFDSKNS
jgi:hypothetical protein